ncbi:MAG: hypothetical protein Q9169_007777 [Polycauliona sp. 2 TL-2023]
MITPDAVEYAILSHTWGDEEISFQDLIVENNLQTASLADHIYALAGQLGTLNSQNIPLKQRKGYQKVEKCCAMALADGYEWAWVDTVCIDKKSSAELSEAINSMYDWYQKSAKCYVYMSDVSMVAGNGDSDATVIDEFRSSRWFRRGWTLQELLAPSHIIFYDRDWRYLGDKLGLTKHITIATGIDERYLRDNRSFEEASIAKRMSWASRRLTTRMEDEAYCLLGLFQVNMSLLYGEGPKAFIRLQHEIIRNCEDESIFAWHSSEIYSGIFAKRPASFTGCGHYFPWVQSDIKAERRPSAMTPRGLSLDVVYRETAENCNDRISSRSLRHCILVPLNCTSQYSSKNAPFAIILARRPRDVYARHLAGEIVDFKRLSKNVFSKAGRATIYVRDYEETFYPHRSCDTWSSISGQFAGKSYNGLITLDRQSLDCHAIEKWFITPPGHIISPDNVRSLDRELRLSGWSGFALLAFKDLDQYPFCICITYGQMEDYRTAFILHKYELFDYGSRDEFISTCFDQLEERKSSLEVRTTYILRISKDRAITLKRQISEDEECSYVLGVESV